MSEGAAAAAGAAGLASARSSLQPAPSLVGMLSPTDGGGRSPIGRGGSEAAAAKTEGGGFQGFGGGQAAGGTSSAAAPGVKDDLSQVILKCGYGTAGYGCCVHPLHVADMHVVVWSFIWALC